MPFHACIIRCKPSKQFRWLRVSTHSSTRQQWGYEKALAPTVTNIKRNTGKVEPTRKPYLILHMGPDKTGTTTIQSALEEYAHILNQDGYDVTFSKEAAESKHKAMARNLIGCFSERSAISQPCHMKYKESWANFKATLEAQAKNATAPNIIWSNESFRWVLFGESPDWKEFLAFIREFYQVHVVLVYRRYFDWFVSRYNEEYLDSYTVATFPGGTYGRPTPTFPVFLEKEQNGTCIADKHTCRTYYNNRYDGAKRQPGHPIVLMLRHLLAQNISVNVLNFHGEDLLKSFVCEGLVDAKQTCQYLHGHPQARRQDRSSQVANLQYDRIAVYAYYQGLLPNTTTRKISRAKLKEYFTKGNQSLPWVCPSPSESRQLEELSASFEVEAQSLLAQQGQSKLTFPIDHGAAFEKSLSKKKYCYANMSEILQDNRTLEFLRYGTGK
eukprot:Nitzschia sp. Nitz4//scaffold273_size25297//9477//10918//NITZ4_008317-RA/size25297-snap-gene-0.7-mRNA-1//-1//CDS//3329545250//5292//frame0